MIAAQGKVVRYLIGVPTRLERGAQGPVELRRHVRFAAKPACAQWGVGGFLDRAGNQNNAGSRQLDEPWGPRSQPSLAKCILEL